MKFDSNLIFSFGEEDFFVIVNGQTEGETDDKPITILHLEHFVLS